MRQAFPAHASCGVAGLAWCDGSYVYRAVALLALAFQPATTCLIMVLLLCYCGELCVAKDGVVIVLETSRLQGPRARQDPLRGFSNDVTMLRGYKRHNTTLSRGGIKRTLT